MAKKLSDKKFMRLFEELGGDVMAKTLGMDQRGIYRRRRNLEKKYEVKIGAPNAPATPHERGAVYEAPGFSDGKLIIGSDAHYWPGPKSTGHRAFVEAIAVMQPKMVILNGDVIDAATISRHPPIGWERMPTVAEEIEVAQERLAEIEAVMPDKAEGIWTLGNHDARYETRLASVAPEYRNIHGVHLKDHFPNWRPAFMVDVNDVLVKHRFKGGMYAPQNNVLWAGKSMVTGHTHALRVLPVTTYPQKTLFGVDGGTLADPTGDQFTGYSEASPLNWRQGFVILTFEKGRLLWPEVVHVVEPGLVEFRGKTYEV